MYAVARLGLDGGAARAILVVGIDLLLVARLIGLSRGHLDIVEALEVFDRVHEERGPAGGSVDHPPALAVQLDSLASHRLG